MKRLGAELSVDADPNPTLGLEGFYTTYRSLHWFARTRAR